MRLDDQKIGWFKSGEKISEAESKHAERMIVFLSVIMGIMALINGGL